MYSPVQGRWLQQDPLGYVDSMSVYSYCLLRPLDRLDPEGLSTAVRDQAARRMMNEWSKHVWEPYYAPTGLAQFLCNAFQVLGSIDVGWKLNPYGAEATWDHRWNVMYIQKTSSGITVIHELVHAMDDLNDWHVSKWWADYEASEGLAYATEFLLTIGGQGLQSVRMAQDAKQAADLWTAVWRDLGRMNGEVATGFFGSRRLQASDFWDVKARLGVQFSCSQLRPVYEQYFADRGITVCLSCPDVSGSPFD